MKELFAEIRGAVLATLVLALVCCGLYPLVVFGIGQALFRDKANGSLILDKDGAIRGSRLLGQGFTAQQYFHPRPSAAGHGYDAAPIIPGSWSQRAVHKLERLAMGETHPLDGWQQVLVHAQFGNKLIRPGSKRSPAVAFPVRQ